MATSNNTLKNSFQITEAHSHALSHYAYTIKVCNEVVANMRMTWAHSKIPEWCSPHQTGCISHAIEIVTEKLYEDLSKIQDHCEGTATYSQEV